MIQFSSQKVTFNQRRLALICEIHILRTFSGKISVWLIFPLVAIPSHLSVSAYYLSTAWGNFFHIFPGMYLNSSHTWNKELAFLFSLWTKLIRWGHPVHLGYLVRMGYVLRPLWGLGAYVVRVVMWGAGGLCRLCGTRNMWNVWIMFNEGFAVRRLCGT